MLCNVHGKYVYWYVMFYFTQGRVVRFHDQLFSGSGDRVVLQTDRVPSFVVPSCQPSVTAVGSRTVSHVECMFQ